MRLFLPDLRVLPLVVFVAALAAPVAAQEVGRADVSAGWKMLRTFDEDEEQTFAKGWYVDLATNVNDSMIQPRFELL